MVNSSPMGPEEGCGTICAAFAVSAVNPWVSLIFSHP